MRMERLPVVKFMFIGAILGHSKSSPVLQLEETRDENITWVPKNGVDVRLVEISARICIVPFLDRKVDTVSRKSG